MIVHTYALTAPVSPSAVWRHWVDVDQWTDHFSGLASARLNGPVAIGAVGRRPRGGGLLGRCPGT